MTELIITEKPKTAQKIALALNPKAKKLSEKGIPYYELELNGKKVYVASAVGHIFTLKEKDKEKNKERSFPVFDIEWKPSYEVSKSSDYTKKYYNVLKKLSKKAEEFTVATDFDVEGEVIGYNIIRYIAEKPDAYRMKFSTLTKNELQKAYENKLKSLNWPSAYAGETRHILDWFYGINLSRALSSAVKKGGLFKILSTGRVQAPALKIVADKELEIRAFKPKKYYEIKLLLHKQKDFEAIHEEERIFEEEKAKKIYEKIKEEKKAIVIEKKSIKSKINPPVPFDLTTLQSEAYSLFKIKPSKTLEIAQELYVSGLISYPRTSSQQLPESINYKGILKQLKENEEYKNLAEELLKEKILKPNNGKKTDPAHPAIYPTGLKQKLEGYEKKLYDLIVKRFLSTFSKPAIKETVTIKLEVKEEKFKAKGSTILEEGWMKFYKPYVKRKDELLPIIEEKEEIQIKKTKIEEKETQPPKRYTPASLVKELEKRGLGTKATRSSIIETLYERGYIKGESIEVTELGLETIKILEKYLPEIVDENLTRQFEKEMEEISNNPEKQKEVLEKAKKVITSVLEKFKTQEKTIGKELVESLRKEERKNIVFGKCPKDDGELILKKGKYGRFIACSNYPECTVTINVPNKGILKPTEKTCEFCGYPIAIIGNNKKNAKEMCINPNCPGKNKKLENSKEGTLCPKCKKGKLVLRKSSYGSFYGCSNYPKCKYTEKIQ